MLKGWFVPGCVLLACSAARVDSAAPSTASLAVIAVCPASRAASADWPAARFPGALFSVANDHGYLATVRIKATSRDCDDCPGPVADAELVDGRWWDTATCEFAVGPVNAPLRQLRVSPMNDTSTGAHAVTPWRERLRIDLDGNGRSDLVGVERCDHVVPSGCNDQVCDRTCQGVRAAAPDGQVRFVECRGFIPDAVDGGCRPAEVPSPEPPAPAAGRDDAEAPPFVDEREPVPG